MMPPLAHRVSRLCGHSWRHGGDVLHFESCSHILLRTTTIRGLGTIANYDVPQEVLKANQCQHVYIENCDISGAWENAVDFVAVQYGHVVGSRIHRSGDWATCAAYLARDGWGGAVITDLHRRDHARLQSRVG